MKRLIVTAALCAIASAQSDTLVPPMNAFAAAWNQFAAQYKVGVLDVRLAKKLSKLWHQVESSGAWPANAVQ